jgi:hypothetical protein
MTEKKAPDFHKGQRVTVRYSSKSSLWTGECEVVSVRPYDNTVVVVRVGHTLQGGFDPDDLIPLSQPLPGVTYD